MVRGFNESVIVGDKKDQNVQQGLIKKMLTKLGIIKREPNSKNLLNTINTIKGIKTK